MTVQEPARALPAQRSGNANKCVVAPHIHIYIYIHVMRVCVCVCECPGHTYTLCICISRRVAASNSQAVRCACFCLFSSAPRLLLRNRGPARPSSQQGGQLQFTTCSAGTNVGADGHTASNAPDLFRPPKLSGAGRGQYWGGGPPGKTLGCCQLLAASKTQQDGQAASKTASCNLPPVLPEHTHTLYIYLHPGRTEIY